MKKVFPSLTKPSKLYQTEIPLEDSIRVSAETPHRFDDHLEKELNRLESELDSYEITNLNTPTKDHIAYRNYLQGLALALKKSKPFLSIKILRGVSGWDKCMNFSPLPLKLSQKIVQKIEKSLKSIETQTETTENLKETKNFSDILQFLALSKSIKKIKISRLTSKLNDIYEKLKVLDIEVPSGSSTPELPEYDLDELKSVSPRFNFKGKNLEELKNGIRKDKARLLIDKEVQVDAVRRQSGLNEGAIDREIEIVRKKRELEMVLLENKKLIERIQKLSEEKEKKDEVLDKETEKILKNEVFDKKSFDLLKNKIEVLNAKCIKQQKKISSLDSMLFNTKVLWKTAEEKLKQINKAWEIQTGASFVFKSIDLKKVIEDIKSSELIDKDLIKNLKINLEAQKDENFDNEEIEKFEKSFPNNEIFSNRQSKIISKRVSKVKNADDAVKVVGSNEKTIKLKEKIDEELKNNDKKIKEKNEEHHDKNKKSHDRRKIEGRKDTGEDDDFVNRLDVSRDHDNLDHYQDKRQKNQINIKSSHKGKTISLDSKHAINEITTDELQRNSISRTQKLKQRINLPSSQSPFNLLTSETPDSKLQFKLKQKLQKTLNLNSSQDITLDNYEEFLMNAYDIDKAFILKKFIDSLIQKLNPKSRYSRANPQTIIKLPENSIQLSQPDLKSLDPEATIPIPDSYFDFLEMPNKDKPKQVLSKIFNFEEIKLLPITAKKKINELLLKHDLNCDDICEHLKRVLALKYKIFGIRYPLKTHHIKFKST